MSRIDGLDAVTDAGADDPNGPGAEVRDGQEPDEEVDEAFDRLVREGHERLSRPMRELLATGTLGGIDVGVGVLAYFVVTDATGSQVLGGLAFSVGFVALLLAHSELFTENFLVPVTAAAAARGSWTGLARLWAVTLLTNVVGGSVTVSVIVLARPDLEEVAREAGEHYADLGFTLRSFLLAVLAGLVITLMTRMQHSSESMGVKIVPAILFGAVLVGAELFHCVLDAIFMVGAMVAGSEISAGQLLGAVGWAALGNLVGGIGFVTFLRLLRTAPKVEAERERATA